ERPQVIRALDSALAPPDGRHVVVAAHHPLRSGGVHGGHVGLVPHLFPLRDLSDNLWLPLPVLGSYYAFNRKQGASNQDVNGPENVRMRRALDWVFARRKPLVYVAGHEHSLQVFHGHSARHLLVSGSGIYGHVSEVHQTDGTRYAAALSGFMRLDFLRDGRVRLGVITVNAERVTTEAFAAFREEECSCRALPTGPSRPSGAWPRSPRPPRRECSSSGRPAWGPNPSPSPRTAPM